MSWTLENYDRLLVALGEHIVLVGIRARALARHRPAARHLVGATAALYVASMPVTGVLYTVPALALFALLIPFMGLGTGPAIIALVLYSLLILVRNVATGMREVPAEMIDAADGMGFGPWRRLLADRAAAGAAGDRRRHPHHRVTQISVATVAAYINAGGLGDIIFQGITQDFGEKIFAGAVAHLAAGDRWPTRACAWSSGACAPPRRSAPDAAT